MDGCPSRNSLSLYFPSSTIKGDDRARMFSGPSNVPRVPEGDCDFIMLWNVPKRPKLPNLLSAFAAPVSVPTGIGLHAFYRTGWRKPVSALSGPSCRRLFAPLSGNDVPSPNRQGEVWSPTACVPWVLGLAPMIVPSAQQVDVLSLACGAVGVAKRCPDRKDSVHAWARGCVHVFRDFLLPVVVPGVGFHGCSEKL